METRYKRRLQADYIRASVRTRMAVMDHQHDPQYTPEGIPVIVTRKNLLPERAFHLLGMTQPGAQIIFERDHGEGVVTRQAWKIGIAPLGKGGVFFIR